MNDTDPSLDAWRVFDPRASRLFRNPFFIHAHPEALLPTESARTAFIQRKERLCAIASCVPMYITTNLPSPEDLRPDDYDMDVIAAGVGDIARDLLELEPRDADIHVARLTDVDYNVCVGAFISVTLFASLHGLCYMRHTARCRSIAATSSTLTSHSPDVIPLIVFDFLMRHGPWLLRGDNGTALSRLRDFLTWLDADVNAIQHSQTVTSDGTRAQRMLNYVWTNAVIDLNYAFFYIVYMVLQRAIAPDLALVTHLTHTMSINYAHALAMDIVDLDIPFATIPTEDLFHIDGPLLTFARDRKIVEYFEFLVFQLGVPLPTRIGFWVEAHCVTKSDTWKETYAHILAYILLTCVHEHIQQGARARYDDDPRAVFATWDRAAVHRAAHITNNQLRALHAQAHHLPTESERVWRSVLKRAHKNGNLSLVHCAVLTLTWRTSSPASSETSVPPQS